MKSKSLFYFTCGQIHSHQLSNGNIWNKDSIISVFAKSLEIAEECINGMFGNEWCNSYSESDIDESFMNYYPGGIVNTIEA